MNSRRKTLQRILWLSLAGLVLAMPSQALDDPRRNPKPAQSSPFELGALETWRIAPTWQSRLFPVKVSELIQPLPIRMEIFDTLSLPQRWQRKILSLPFRPVEIGHPPRLPADPETGVALVLRLPFSF